MKNLDRFFNVIRPAFAETHYDDIPFIRKYSNDEVQVYPSNITKKDTHLLSHIDFDFLYSSDDNLHVYDSEAIKKSLLAMKQLDYSNFSDYLQKKLIQATGKQPKFFNKHDFNPCFQDLITLFEKADIHGLYIVSYRLNTHNSHHYDYRTIIITLKKMFNTIYRDKKNLP